ncbi:hypothetical protein [Hyunsoonleella pacifica]|uniref:Uncharacterized protein n=1 Tax=Hyunsoonleella pacifica TaxID=1080224 RepID=A0A4Q9FT77_9FLAO|nr:hypothetical protein [Hyunsoonleella pacifica]TBN17502.1 hypothetical protein EYD46_04080 [Hyunsoonleella pacifica]GGD11462.1 hypothetical protein GCM10011368_11770 [Hyunsoonleella pacifica]
MKTYRLLITLIVSIISLMFVSRLQAQSQDVQTIKRLVEFTYFSDPTVNSRSAIKKDDVISGTYEGTFWTDTNIDELQNFVKALLQTPANGGDATLQNYVAQVLRLTNRKILIYLWNDDASRTRSQYAHPNKPCVSDYDRSASGVNNRVWPCASHLTVAQDPNWGGYVHVGQYYGQDKGLTKLKATFIHEFMHTQDPVSALNNRFEVNGHLYRYSSDGTHFYTEALPNKRAAYKEAVANTLSLMFDGADLNHYLDWYANNGNLIVERETPHGFFRFFREILGYSDDVWLYDQIKEAIGAGTPDGIVRGYDAYPVRSLPARFIVHNETITAMALAITSMHVRDIDPFMFGIKKVNDAIKADQSKDPFALILNKMALGLTSRGDSLAQIKEQLDSSGVQDSPYYIVLPLAYFDFFTGYSASSKSEFNTLFNNQLDSTLLDIYWNYFKTRVRTVSIPPIPNSSGSTRSTQSRIWDNLTDVSIKCGVTQSMMPGVEDFNFEPPSSGDSTSSGASTDTASIGESSSAGASTSSDGACRDWPSFGTEASVTANGVTIPVFNANATQKNNIEQTLTRLPADHLRSIPRIIIVSNDGPNYFLSHPERGGASWRCNPANRDKEWIKLSAYSLSEARNRRINYTLLHEIGHFIDRDHQILSGHQEEARRYLRDTNYGGSTTGAGEAIAQGYMYYFVTTTAQERRPRVRDRLPRYLIDILENSTAWNNHENW